MGLSGQRSTEEQLRLQTSALQAAAEGLTLAATALSAILDPDEIFEVILEQILHVVPTCAVSILLLENEKIILSRQRGFNAFPEALHAFQASLPLSAFPLLQTISQTRQPVLVSDTSVYPGWTEIPGNQGIYSYIAVPMIIKEWVIGFITIASPQPNFITGEITGFLKAFAAHAVAAIQNSHLYKDLENALDQERAMRSQLVQAEKFAAMSRMVASVAHELNNPLQTIENCLYLIQLKTPPGASIDEFLGMASTETQRLTNLVAQLRELYRPRTEVLKPVDVTLILDEVISLLAQKMAENKIQWHFTKRDRPIFVNGAEDPLKQVFINIITNAIQAMQPKGGSLEIRLLVVDESPLVGIAFTDTGTGIKQENMNKIFEPFFTTKATGVGLGLSICYEIVERFGGKIQVDSLPGEETTFTIWLPIMID